MKVTESLNLFGAIAIGALLVGIAEPSIAAAPDPAPSKSDQAGSGIEEILVTARRREETLISVPVSVTALSGQDLRAANVTSVLEIGRVVPSLRISSVVARADTPAFTIRGLTDTSGFITSDPAVGVYFADAIQPRPQGLGRALFDIASIQVLKGPQGTFFGKNLTGGAILIAPVAPQLNDFSGYVQGTYGSYNRREGQGAVNIPIGDKVALRVGANIVRRDGYYHNLLTGNDLRTEHSDSFRASLLLAPSENFRNTTVVDTFKGHSNAGGLVPVYVNPAADIPGLNPYALRLAALQRQQARSNYDVEENQDSPQNSSNYGVTNTSVLDAGGLTIKNIFNYRRVVSNDITEDGLPIQIAMIDSRVRTRQYSDELQVSGSMFDKRIEYVTGGYFFWEHGRSTSLITAFGSPTPANLSQATNETESVFAQADFHITSQLTLTAGGRYTWDDRSYGFTTTLPNGVVSGQGRRKKSFAKPTYTVSLNYKPNKDALLYVTTRRGYRSGGFNGGATSVAQLNVIQPEILTDYEVGAKSEGQLGSVGYRTTLAVFRSNYDNIQRNLLAIIDGVPGRTIFNAAKAKVTGGEFEATLIPFKPLSLSGFLGYTDAKYKKFADPLTGADLSGLPFAQTPKWTWRVSGTFTLPAPDDKGGTLSASADYYHSSGFSITDSAIPAGFTGLGYFGKGYGLLGARIAYNHIAGTGLRAAVFGNNLTKKVYTDSGVVVVPPFGYNAFVNGNPRTFGVEVGYEF